MRVSLIDLGSNSIKFLVAEISSGGEAVILAEQSEGTRLGEGLYEEPFLREVAIQRTLAVLTQFRAMAESLNVTQWNAVATSAVRDARNRPLFEQQFQSIMGFPLRVLSGEEEAALIYRGVTSDRQMTPEGTSLLVMDSGGGSAEWIRGTPKQLDQRISLNLGCVRMTERFLRGDPYTEDSFAELIRHYEEQLQPLVAPFHALQLKMIGTGGSICAAAAIQQNFLAASGMQLHGQTLSLAQLEKITHHLRHLTQAERLQIPALPAKRADIVVAGLALFITAMRLFHASEITVSLRNLRYGLLAEF